MGWYQVANREEFAAMFSILQQLSNNLAALYWRGSCVTEDKDKENVMNAAISRARGIGRILSVLFGVWILGAVSAAAQSALLLQKVDTDGSIVSMSLSPEEIDALPQINLTTENEFVDGPTEFSGPLARDVVAMLAKPNAASAVLTAANEYAIEIPLSDFEQYDVLFATTMNGSRLSLRDKGPIWVIYPMSQHAELRDALYNDRLIWQLVRVEIK